MHQPNISKFEKLKARLLKKPKDFPYDELRALLIGLGYTEDNKGRTSGSRVAFVNPGTKHILRIYKPHPQNIILAYALEYIIDELKRQNII